MADLTSLIKQREYAQLGVIMLQESWLHNEIEDEIIHLDGFASYRVDRPVPYSRRGGGVITKERAFKMHKRDAVRSLSKSIRAKLRRLNSLYARARLDNKGVRETWQALVPISGISSSHRASAAVAIGSLNQRFINRGIALTAQPNGYEMNNTDPVSSVATVDIYQGLAPLDPHKSCGPDGVSPAVLKERASFLSPVLIELFNDCISQ
ncbi:unnamed protein product [Echinostoma caproni]|uniref:Reverse transcriptase n=1 Tax=Echinostoma caproni TaxID=27848 RepID=A0A183AHI0_9TREM|nr:unnamed protein product [Echinostoma caproni]